MPPIANLIGSALALAISQQEDLQRKWIDVSMRLYALGTQQALRYQSDLQVDLLLRLMERERLQNLQAPSPTDIEIVTFSFQAALSRYWILSTYEALRTARDAQRGANDRLTHLCRRIEMVRVPLAKLAIAHDQKLDPATTFQKIPELEDETADAFGYVRSEYHPVTAVCTSTGSFGWYPLDVKTMKQEFITRRMLSDELLSLFD